MEKICKNCFWFSRAVVYNEKQGTFSDYCCKKAIKVEENESCEVYSKEMPKAKRR